MLRARSEDAKDERRLALLNAALDEFFEKGFSATRMADIARRAGLSKGTLYLYFKSKDAMFRELIEVLAMPNIQRISEIAEAAQSFEQAMEGFSRLGPELIRTSDMPRLMKVLVGDAHMFPQVVQDYRTELVERVLSIMAGMLRRAHEAGEIRVESPELTARIVIAPVVLSGIWQAMFGHQRGGEVDLDRLFRIHTDLLLAALKTGASE